MAKHPLDRYAETKEAAIKQRDQDDLSAVLAYKNNPNKETTSKLLKQFAPLINHQLPLLKAPNTQQEALRLELQRQLLMAAPKFDETRGARPGTFFTHHITGRGKRFMTRTNNLVNRDEQDVYRIGDIQRADTEMQGQGDDAIAAHINQQRGLSGKRRMTAKRVADIRNFTGIKDVLDSSFDSEMTPQVISSESERIRLLRHDLDDDHRVVMDSMFGINGQPRATTVAAIARQTGKPYRTVAKMQKKILDTYRSSK